MPILSMDDLVDAEKKGSIGFENRLAFQPFSLNLRIGEIYRFKTPLPDLNFVHRSEQLSNEQFKARFLELVDLESGFVIVPNEYFLWEPMETMFLTQGYWGEVVSRSSAGRNGLECTDHDDDGLGIRGIDKNRWIRPLVGLSTFGTKVVLCKGQAIAQLIIKAVNQGPVEVAFYEQLEDLLQSKSLVVSRRGKQVPPKDALYGNAVWLTMAKHILLYQGTLLDPAGPKANDFKPASIPRKGLFLPQGTFFLSRTREYVEVPEEFVGKLLHSNVTYVPRGVLGPSDTHLMPDIQTNPHAPYIGPRTVFCGHIVFENLTLYDTVLYEGMKQGEMNLFRLTSPLKGGTPSPYNLQSADWRKPI